MQMRSAKLPGKLPALIHSLSARLLVLTIFFVMLAEVLIYAPSAGRFRLSYIEERLAAGHLAILALQATPDYMVSEELEAELLNHAAAYVVGLKRPDGVKLMLGQGPVPPIDASFDLAEGSFFPLIGEAFVTLAQSGNRVLRVVGPSPKHPQAIVEVVIDEAPMRAGLIDYSWRILGLSIVISIFTAALVYLSLQWLMVRPMRRMTQSMMAFRENPEDASRLIAASDRRDEIGLAQRELAEMQAGLRAALHQKTHLAALGAAVTKISHDLRNILATARLVSDRLGTSGDPEVQRTTPVLLAAIDRAVDLCSRTLDFTREGPPKLARRRFALGELVAEVGAALPSPMNGATVWRMVGGGGIVVDADRDQLFRVLQNLGQNAFEAGATQVEVTARQEDEAAAGGPIVIEIADNGPGLAPRARDKLFQPFAGTGRAGGTGLGLAIARDLMRAHGGDIRLVSSTAEGTLFRLDLPPAAAGRRADGPGGGRGRAAAVARAPDPS
jgi:signal transduction histidine kinase